MKVKADKIKPSSGRSTLGRATAKWPTRQRAPFESSEFDAQGTDHAVAAQRTLQESIDRSPRQLAQAERVSGLFGPPVQRVEEEEELQMTTAPTPAQREALEEEEPLQGKFSTIQRQELEEEEEEPLQGRFLVAQRQGPEEEELMQGHFDSATARTQLESGAAESENRTGMSDQLKSGLERLSGTDLSDVRVRANSPEPSRLNARAYAQGNDIHLGPGQEQHLPHEAWHVVQQRQGRVQATTQMAGVQINDDASLEREADVMGSRALAQGPEEQES